MNPSIPDYILSLKPYVAGKPLEELEREYGITNAVKLASNENPLGPSPLAVKAIQKAVDKLHRYPDASGYNLTQRISDRLGVKPENIVLGNGSDDIITMLGQVLLQPGDEVILPNPTFLYYKIVTQSCGAIAVDVPLKSHTTDLTGILDCIGPKTQLVFLTNPHNPTGSIIEKADLDAFIGELPANVVVVIDEAYIEFVRDVNSPNSIDYIQSKNAVVGLRTFSKAYGLAGLRIGYGLMPPFLTQLLNRVRQPFNVNSLANVAAMAALDDQIFLANTLRLVHDELDFLYKGLDKLGIRYLKTQANFFLIKVGRNADDVFENLLKLGVIVRSMTSYGYPEYVRVNVGLHEENVRLLDALANVLQE